MKPNPLQYRIHHPSLSSTIHEIEDYMAARNLVPVDNDGVTIMPVECEHVGYGETRRVNRQCITPANTRLGYRIKWVHAVIYRFDHTGTYELTLYTSAPAR